MKPYFMNLIIKVAQHGELTVDLPRKTDGTYHEMIDQVTAGTIEPAVKLEEKLVYCEPCKDNGLL